jgi:long-subunit fatty acid transport protein
MIQRLALFVASLSAAAVMAAALALGGLAPAAGPAAVVTDAPPAAMDAPAQPSVQVDTVYVTPKVKPKHVTVSRTVRSSSGHGEHEGGGDD